MEHGPDEGISEEWLKRALKIYIVSIARLMQLEVLGDPRRFEISLSCEKGV